MPGGLLCSGRCSERTPHWCPVRSLQATDLSAQQCLLSAYEGTKHCVKPFGASFLIFMTTLEIGTILQMGKLRHSNKRSPDANPGSITQEQHFSAMTSSPRSLSTVCACRARPEAQGLPGAAPPPRGTTVPGPRRAPCHSKRRRGEGGPHTTVQRPCEELAPPPLRRPWAHQPGPYLEVLSNAFRRHRLGDHDQVPLHGEPDQNL